MGQRAVIIGAGPAGLTAAHELAHRSDIQPVVLEQSDCLGGISRTVNHRGNRIDIGGHRFFSKSDRVMDWWMARMPVQGGMGPHQTLHYQNQQRSLELPPGPHPDETDRVLLVRDRRSRILHGGAFYDYPVGLSAQTLRNLGLRRSARIGVSYARAMARPIRPERSLEDFLINRFGRELYATFFRDYTEKVWGVPCTEIGADWGAQRIKGLNLRTAAEHWFQKVLPRSPAEDLAQKSTQTSLIERFLYPKLGPGQMWEIVADEVRAAGGEVHTGWRVNGLELAGPQAGAVRATHVDGRTATWAADQVFSTMPLRYLVRGIQGVEVPAPVRAVAQGLMYRDFITVGILADRLLPTERVGGRDQPIKDNWIYVQEPGVHVGRVQLFHNWSPYLLADPSKAWIGLEYFCNRGDGLWRRSDDALCALATREAAQLGLLDPALVRDAVVIRMPHTYPAYFGSFGEFATLRAWLDRIENLWCVGRNGMHRYNNQDHSMLTAMTAVDQVLAGHADKAAVWAVNTEPEYHEEQRA